MRNKQKRLIEIHKFLMSEILHGGIRVQFDARVGVSQVDLDKKA